MKTTNLFFILFITIFGLTFAQQTDEFQMDNTATIHYNNGISLMKAGDYKNAITSFDSCLQSSQDYRVYFQKGLAQFKANKLEDAKATFNTVISLKGDYDLAYLYLGNTLSAMKENDAAIKSYEKFIEVTSNEQLKQDARDMIELTKNNVAIEFYNKGNELSKAGKFEDAIKEYDKSLAINKDYKTYYQKGLTLSKMQKNEDAKKELNNALTLNPAFDLAFLALGKIFAEAKDYDNAIANYVKAIEVTTNDALKTSIKEATSRTYFTIGSNFYKEKKYDKAIENFTKSVEYFDFDQSYLFLGKAQNDKKQYDVALQSFDKAAQFKKTITDGALAYNRGIVYKSKGDNNKALEQFTLGLSDPNYKKACDSEIKFIKALIEKDKKK